MINGFNYNLKSKTIMVLIDYHKMIAFLFIIIIKELSYVLF